MVLCRRASCSARLSAFSGDRKSTRLNSSHRLISYAVFCLKKKKNLLDEPPRGGQVLEGDLEMADADIHEPLNLGDDLRSRRPEAVEGLARDEVMVARPMLV